jgi:acyl carrier protein
LMDGTVGDVRLVLASVVGGDVVDSLKDDELFFDRGIIDSLQLAEIIDRFQSDFGIAVAGEDLSPENFGSITGMARFLETRRAG